MKCIDNLSLNHDTLCAGSAYFSDLYEFYMSQTGDTDGEPAEKTLSRPSFDLNSVEKLSVILKLILDESS
jgi:hypothetical protein